MHFRLCLSLLFSLLFSLSRGQSNQFDLDLRQDTIRASWLYTGNLAEGQDSFRVHFPLQAYINKASFLHEQLREFQDPDLHFARQKDLAFLAIDAFWVDSEEFKISLDDEMLWIKPKGKGPIDFRMEFRFVLPDQKFTGNGTSEKDIRLIDILPRVYSDSNYGNPVSYYYDSNYDRQRFNVNLTLADGFKAISNLKELTTNQFRGISKHLHLFIAKTWVEYPIGGGNRLYLPAADANFAANLKLILQETGGYFKGELNDSLLEGRSYVFLDAKKGEYQSAELLSLKRPKDWMDLRFDLVHAQAESFFRGVAAIDGWKSPWLSRGIPYYYKYHFVETRYPQKRWIPFQSPILNGLFGFDEFNYGYQNRFLFLFLQRQGLDQALSSPVDSLSRLNYEAIIQAKAFLLLSHKRSYVGEQNYKRSMVRFIETDKPVLDLEAMQEAFHYYCPKPLEWFYGPAVHSAGLYDYQIWDYEHCPTVSTATIVNQGELALPYSLTGYSEDGEPILTQWYEGHEDKKTVQLFHEDYHKVVINAHLNHAEYRQKNNTYYSRLILPRMEPLSFQLYNSFEAAEATQVFYVPSVFYNAYDQFLLGINLSNRSILVQKPFEYVLVPEYSTGTGKLTGTASATYNWVTPKSHFFRQIRFGLYSRYNHYDRDLAFYRISPSINFRIRKKYPRSPYIQSVRLRGVILDREIDESRGLDINQVENASYSVFNANYRLEYTSLLRPTIFRFHLEASDQFSKVFAEYDQRWMLPNKKWLILRGFAGGFLHNDFADQGIANNFFSLGLSGTPDYLFDYYFIGRSDQSGIWSRQFFTTDGGFKSETNAFADRFLLSSNLSLPFYGPLGAFADIALSEQGTYWDYGVRLAFVTDFVELYLPIQNQDRNFYSEANYLSNVRFVLDLKLGNIINRVRRGFY